MLNIKDDNFQVITFLEVILLLAVGSLFFIAYTLIKERAITVFIIIYALIFFQALAAILLLKHLNFAVATGFLLASTWFSITYLAWFANDMRYPIIIISYILHVVMTGFFGGRAYGFIITFSSIISIACLNLLYQLGIVTPHINPPHHLAWGITSILTAGILSHIMGFRSIQAIEQAHTNKELLKMSHAELQNLFDSLEERVEERTAEIQQQKQYYQALLQNSLIGIVTLDTNAHIISSNKTFENMFGFYENEIIGQKLDTLIASDVDFNEAAQNTDQVLNGINIRKTAQRKRKNGSLIDVEIHGVPVIINGKTIGILALYNDITERRKAEEALLESHNTFMTVLDSIDTDIYVADIKTHKIIFMNKHMRRTFGEGLIGKTCYRALRNQDHPCTHCSSNQLLDEQGKPTGELIWEDQNPITKQWYINLDRAIRWHDGRMVHIQVAANITHIKETENQLRHLANHDLLTGLPNRRLFHEHLVHALSIARRSGKLVTVMFLDLDNYKEINDQHGHETGDQLLCQLSARFTGFLRESDIVARLGGDEFVFVLENINSLEDSLTIAKKILSIVEKPFFIDGKQLHVTASLGISIFPHHAEVPEILIKYADNAMYTAKNLGGNRYHVHSYSSFLC